VPSRGSLDMVGGVNEDCNFMVADDRKPALMRVVSNFKPVTSMATYCQSCDGMGSEDGGG
jgi:hypothetical protein